MIYLIHFSLLCIYACLYLLSPRTKLYRQLFIIITFLQTFLLYALRSSYIGTDTGTMVLDYLYPSTILSGKAPLYSLIKAIFHFFIPNGQGYMIMCGLFIIGGTAYYIYRNSKDIILSTFLFFALYSFFQSMNIALQFIALVLIVNGMVLIGENRKLSSFVLFVSALFIHSTSILLMPLLTLLFIKKNTTKRIFFICYCIGLICYEPLLNFFTLLFPLYTIYTDSGSWFEAGQNRKILLTIFYLFLLIGSYWTYYKIKHNNTPQENNQWEFLLFCLTATVLIGFLALKSILLTRIEYYFSFTLILFIPLALSKFNSKSRQILYLLTCGIMVIPGIFQFMANYGQIRPYLFFWE